MPTPDDESVLIRIQAASVNPYDLHMMNGTRTSVLSRGLRWPRSRARRRCGWDRRAVSRNVTTLKVGDEVFGGAKASFVVRCARASSVVIKPKELSFPAAAAMSMAVSRRSRGCATRAGSRPGSAVLVNGAGGGVGTMAVQIAKAFGAKVTGVCSTGNVDMVRSIGADHVVDYTKGDFVDGGQRFDVMIDNVGTGRCAMRGKRWSRRACMSSSVRPTTASCSGRPPDLGSLPDRLRQPEGRDLRREDMSDRICSRWATVTFGLADHRSHLPLADALYAPRDVGRGHARGRRS